MKRTLVLILSLFLVIGVSLMVYQWAQEESEVSPIPMADNAEDVPELSVTESVQPTTRTVQLFYYNPELDTDETGNILCSRDGLVPVTREISGITPIEDTLRLLIAGELTAAERAAGITTEYPLPGVVLNSVTLQSDGELIVELQDPQNATVGGSCRAAILWSQIRQTALQFEEVSEVSFQPEDLFQP